MEDDNSVSSDDSFSYKNTAKRALEIAKKKIAAVKPSAKTDCVFDVSSGSDSELNKNAQVSTKEAGKSKRKRQGPVRRCKKQMVTARRANNGNGPLNVAVLDDYSSGSDSVEDIDGSLSSTSPIRMSPKPGNPISEGKFDCCNVLDSEESDKEVYVKDIVTVSDSSDIEVCTPSNCSVASLDVERHDENELMSIKISWKLQPVQKFQLRRHQKFKALMDHFAKLEGVPLQKIVLYGGKNCSRLIEPFDTPDTVGVTVTDILEGGVLVEGGESRATRLRGLAAQPGPTDGITVKVQLEGGVRSFPVMIGREQRMQVLMVKVAEQMEVDVSKVKLSLDGEMIAPGSYAQDLDLEEGDVLDVHLR